jgi:hypothetical protein
MDIVGEVDGGFRYVIDGWNAERILLASEAIGDGYWFIQRAVDYATKREVLGKQIGATQAVKFPLADAYMKVRAADMMRYEAARLFDEGKPCGAEADMAKPLVSEASWAARRDGADSVSNPPSTGTAHHARSTSAQWPSRSAPPDAWRTSTAHAAPSPGPDPTAADDVPKPRAPDSDAGPHPPVAPTVRARSDRPAFPAARRFVRSRRGRPGSWPGGGARPGTTARRRCGGWV